MPKLTVGSTEIRGVLRAVVRYVHQDRLTPDSIPIMEWEISMRLQSSNFLPKWALAGQQTNDHWRTCELVIFHTDGSVAHTWSIPNGYVHKYEEIEDSGDSSGGGACYRLNLVIRNCVVNTDASTMTAVGGEDPAKP